MASYSFTPTQQGSSYFGGGWGNDIASFGHSMYSGMTNGMNFANSLYDLQRKVALMPYEQNAQIANYNANQKQDELSADKSGFELKELTRAGAITSGGTINRGLGYDANTRAAAGIQGSATNPNPVVASGQTVGAVAQMPKEVIPVAAPAASGTTFAQATLGAGTQNQTQMPGYFYNQPAQNMSPVPPEWSQSTAPAVVAPQAYVDYTQDPTPQANAWVDGAYYGRG